MIIEFRKPNLTEHSLSPTLDYHQQKKKESKKEKRKKITALPHIFEVGGK